MTRPRRRQEVRAGRAADPTRLPGAPAASASPRALWFCLPLVVAAVLVAHWPALSARAMLFDDAEYLTDNVLVQSPGWSSAGRFLQEVCEPSTVRGYYQPLAMISLMLDHALGGRPDHLRPFHRTSLALHAANTALIVVLLYGLFGQPVVAAMAGLIFGVHPLTVEPIPWVGERKTLLAAFFALASLIAYVRFARRGGRGAYVAALACYVLALLSKPTSTPLPIAMLLMDLWPLRRFSRRAILEKLPFFAVGALFGAITVVSQARTAIVELPSRYPPSRIPLILCHNVVFYLVKGVWPARLSPHYPFPDPLDLTDPMVAAGVVGTSVLVGVLVISLRRTRALAAGWLIFLVMLLPTAGVLGFTIVIASDKYAYLPAVGLLMVLAWAMQRVWSGGPARRACLVAAVLVAAGLLTAGTRRCLARWQTSEALLDHALSLTPDAPELLNARGVAWDAARDHERAILAYTRAITLRPDYARAYNNRGNAYRLRGELEPALRDYDRAIALFPRSAAAYLNRGHVYDGKNLYDRAIADYTRSIALRPTQTAAYLSRALGYAARGDHDLAMRDFHAALAIRPDDPDLYYARGNVRTRKGDLDEAIRDYDRAIDLRPEYADAFNNRASAFYAKGDYARALADYNRAIDLQPDQPRAYKNRAVVYLLIGDYDRASADVRRCRELGGTPDPAVVQALTQPASRPE